MEKLNEEYLGKIIRLAKNGEGGEKENAIRIIKKLCRKHGLVFEDIMSSTDIQEYNISCRTTEFDLLIWIIYRYANTNINSNIWCAKNKTYIIFETTPAKFIETQNAFDILKIKFKNEKKLMQEVFYEAFRIKHNLYYQPTEEEFEEYKKLREKEDKKENSDVKKKKEEIKKSKMMFGIVSALDDVKINKQLKQG